MFIAICEMSKTYWRTGKLPVKDESENSFRDQPFHLKRCSSIIPFQQKINLEFTNLGRKSDLEYFLDMHRSRGESGKELF